MKKIFYILLTGLITVSVETSCKGPSVSQSEKIVMEGNMDRKLNSKNFTFEAQDALPTGGRNIPLTSSYSLKVSGDSMISSLPYFGRAYTAPLNPTESAYMFTTTQFDYNVDKREKDGWIVTITPTERHKGEKFILTTFSNGSASLQVTSNDRQPITFRGRLK